MNAILIPPPPPGWEKLLHWAFFVLSEREAELLDGGDNDLVGVVV